MELLKKGASASSARVLEHGPRPGSVATTAAALLALLPATGMVGAAAKGRMSGGGSAPSLTAAEEESAFLAAHHDVFVFLRARTAITRGGAKTAKCPLKGKDAVAAESAFASSIVMEMVRLGFIVDS
jgi:hypothetical protein